MRVHFIAIGGAAMHNLALALHQKGDSITGSDDEIFDPSKSRLESEGLLPREYGWFPEKISEDIDAIIEKAIGLTGNEARDMNDICDLIMDLMKLILHLPNSLY